MENSCFQAPCVQIENTSTPPILFLFTLATVACVATKRHEELVQWPDELIPKITGHVRLLRSSLLVIIINQDKNVTLRMKPTPLCNPSVLYHWFSRNATNNSRVPHMLEDKSPFTCITSFIACVASVSVLFRNKERGPRENGASKRGGGGFLLSFHFLRGQNRESWSSVFLCSETARKRLLRRLLAGRITFRILGTFTGLPYLFDWTRPRINTADGRKIINKRRPQINVAPNQKNAAFTRG